MTKAKAKAYRVTNGISYARPGRPRTGPGSTDEVRHEAGEVVDLPDDVAAAYLEHGDIEDASTPAAPPVEAPADTPPPSEGPTNDKGA